MIMAMRIFGGCLIFFPIAVLIKSYQQGMSVWGLIVNILTLSLVILLGAVLVKESYRRERYQQEEDYDYM